MRAHFLTAAIVFLRCRYAGAAEDSAATVLDRYLDAMGGKEALAAIEDRTYKFEQLKTVPSADSAARQSQYLKKGFRVREEWDLQGVQIKGQSLAFTQVYDGRRGWVLMFGSLSVLEGRTLAIFVGDKFLDDPLCHWEEDGYRAALLGKDTLEGEPVEVVELADFRGARKERYLFSSRSGLLLKKEWGEKEVPKAILYRKYTAIPFADGSGRRVQFPLYQEVYDNGKLDAKREFKEVKINSGLADGLFERPGSAASGQPPPKDFPQPPHPGEVKASPILVGSSAEAESIRAAVIASGGTLDAFMEAARRHSKDVATKRAGGALGWFGRGRKVRQFSEAAFALHQGEVSKPIKTEDGWHLIYIEADGDLPPPAKRF